VNGYDGVESLWSLLDECHVESGGGGARVITLILVEVEV